MSALRAWRVVLDQASVPGYGDSSFTATRASNEHAEMVFLEHNGDLWWMTREQAVDLGESLMKVSGMATSTAGAPYLADVITDTMFLRGVTRSRLSKQTGITRYRLQRILRALVPMTRDEHIAIANVTGEVLS